jgi:protein transport protein SEC31
LEIFSMDLGSSTGEMELLGTVQTAERFHRLAWGVQGTANSVPHGMLAGGTVDGSINIYNPALISQGRDALIASVERHKQLGPGGVRALEFNPGVPNLLASGAGESEIIITDLSNPSAPSVYAPGASSSALPTDISCVAWNLKVQHILASTGHNGQSVVWDLKLKRPVISFADPSNKAQRNSVIQWSPEMSTQVR